MTDETENHNDHVPQRPRRGPFELALEVDPKHPPIFDVKIPRDARCVLLYPRVRRSGVIFQKQATVQLAIVMLFDHEVGAELVDHRLAVLPCGGWAEDAVFIGAMMNPLNLQTGQLDGSGGGIAVYSIPREVEEADPLDVADAITSHMAREAFDVSDEKEVDHVE